MFDEIEDYLERWLHHKHRRKHHLDWTIDGLTVQGATRMSLDLLATDIGTTVSLKVSVLDAAGNATTDPAPIVFSNDNSAAATLTDNGDGTASVAIVASGTANIGATDGTLAAAPFTITVAAGVPASLVIEQV